MDSTISLNTEEVVNRKGRTPKRWKNEKVKNRKGQKSKRSKTEKVENQINTQITIFNTTNVTTLLKKCCYKKKLH